SRSGTPALAPENVPWIEDARIGNTGVFVEGAWKPNPKMSIAFGVREDRASARDARASTDDMMPRPNPSKGWTRKASLQSGFLRLEQNLTSNLQWYAGVGHVERMPDYWELFSASTGPVGTVNAFS